MVKFSTFLAMLLFVPITQEASSFSEGRIVEIDIPKAESSFYSYWAIARVTTSEGVKEFYIPYQGDEMPPLNVLCSIYYYDDEIWGTPPEGRIIPESVRVASSIKCGEVTYKY